MAKWVFARHALSPKSRTSAVMNHVKEISNFLVRAAPQRNGSTTSRGRSWLEVPTCTVMLAQLVTGQNPFPQLDLPEEDPCPKLGFGSRLAGARLVVGREKIAVLCRYSEMSRFVLVTTMYVFGGIFAFSDPPRASPCAVLVENEDCTVSTQIDECLGGMAIVAICSMGPRSTLRRWLGQHISEGARLQLRVKLSPRW